jgi:hypothetical protein
VDKRPPGKTRRAWRSSSSARPAARVTVTRALGADALAEVALDGAPATFVPLDATEIDDCCVSPVSPCWRARTARRGARSRWWSSTRRNVDSSASRSAASRRSSTSSPMR